MAKARVLVAMSGGVDSSVAAGLLVEAGHDVVGVHMKLHDAAPGTGQTCCGLDDALDARRVAQKLGIPFYVVDLQEAFRAAVMDDLARTYLAGATPSPCVRCNGVLKFDLLLRRADLLGAELLATGHYARVHDGRLFVAADPGKDQSYFLFPIRPEVLPRVRFPLGELTKAEVRAQAVRLGLATAQKPESMEVCFLPDDDHARFVEGWAKARDPGFDGAGEIVDEAGRVLGRHDGYHRYTIGQRRGLGVAAPTPLYVLRIEPDTRRVVVGSDAALLSWGIVARGATWFRPPEGVLHARVRHRGALHPCTVELTGADVVVHLRAPARAVTPGQAVVLYDGDEVVGGAWIRSARAA